jgi:iron complex transport system ATP-binding protein
MTILTLRDVDFAYAEHLVLRHVTFGIEQGALVGIVGPNGSGKSTLIDLIDGLAPPRAGEVLLYGRPAHAYRRREMAQHVALVPQQFSLDFDLSVREVVEMGGYCRQRQREGVGDAAETLARLGIAHLEQRRFFELSGGEKQLVVLAQALSQRASLLMLDEPASALDVAHQLALFDLLKMLNGQGLTILCVLHDLNLAMHYFDTLLVLSQGEVAAFGEPEDVLTPELLQEVYGVHAYVHRHAGRTFLTFSPRRRRDRRGRIHLVCGGGTGSRLMRELVDEGFEVTAGVLNALDGDEAVGRELGLHMAVEAPFSPVSDRAHAENLELIMAADLVVLAGVPVGNGNARNIEAIGAGLAAGKDVWAVANVRENDFTGAVAQLAGERLRYFADERQLLAEVRRREPLPGHPQPLRPDASGSSAGA